MHDNVANLEFLGKSEANPKYCLLFVNLFSSKVCTYPMKIRKLVPRKMKVYNKDEKVEKIEKASANQSRIFAKQNQKCQF